MTPAASPTSNKTDSKIPATRLFGGIFGLSLLLCLWPMLARLGFLLDQIGSRLPYPYFQFSSEGLILSEAGIIRAGGSIYVPFRADSFISAPYPPLYYYLLAWLWPTGQDANLFEPGRVISLVSALVAAALVAGLVYWTAQVRSGLQKVGPGLLSLLAGLTFLTLPAVNVWAVRLRADMLMTALQLVGLGLVAFGFRRQQAGWLFAALPLFALALFTKQTALAGPLAAGLFITLQYGRRWRVWLSWWISLTLAVALPLVILSLLTHNELFRRLFKYHNLPWRIENFQTYLGLFGQENAALLCMGGVLLSLTLVVGWRFWRSSTAERGLERWLGLGRQVPLLVWFWLAALGSLISLGVAGADHNHFLPVEAANCAVAGALAVRLLESGRWRWVVLVALVGFWLQLSVFSVPPSRYNQEFAKPDAVAQAQLKKIQLFATSRPGPILSSEAAWLVLSDKNDPSHTYYNDLFTLVALDKQGLYSQAGLLDRIRRKEFGLILAENDLFSQSARPDVWTPALVAAIQENYKLQFRDSWFSYIPKE